MAETTVSRTINAPVERVWQVFTDLPSIEENIKGITSVELLSEGDFAVGTRWRETRTMFGRSASEEMWVTDSRPPQAYRVEAESHGSHYTSEYTFRAVDGGTEVTLVFTAEPQGTMAKIMATATGWMAKGMIDKQFRADLDDLAAICERGA